MFDRANGGQCKALLFMLRMTRRKCAPLIANGWAKPFIGRGSGFVAVEIPFTPRTKRVLELSLEEARQLDHNYIGTKHLLLGLIREGEGVGIRVLENLGVDLSKVRTQVIRILGETAEVSAGSGGAQGRNKTPTLDESGSNPCRRYSAAIADRD